MTLPTKGRSEAYSVSLMLCQYVRTCPHLPKAGGRHIVFRCDVMSACGYMSLLAEGRSEAWCIMSIYASLSLLAEGRSEAYSVLP